MQILNIIFRCSDLYQVEDVLRLIGSDEEAIPSGSDDDRLDSDDSDFEAADLNNMFTYVYSLNMQMIIVMIMTMIIIMKISTLIMMRMKKKNRKESLKWVHVDLDDPGELPTNISRLKKR